MTLAESHGKPVAALDLFVLRLATELRAFSNCPVRFRAASSSTVLARYLGAKKLACNLSPGDKGTASLTSGITLYQ